MEVFKVLDPKTLVIILSMIHVTVSLSFMVASFTYKQTSLRIFTLGTILSGLGFFMLSYQGINDPFFNIMVANLLLITGELLVMQGLVRFLGKPFPWHFLAIGLIIHTALFTYYLYIVPDTAARIVIFSLEQILINGIVASLFLRHYLKENEMNALHMTLLYGLFSLMFILRIGNVVRVGQVPQLFRVALPLQLTVLFSMFMAVSRGYVFILMVVNRLQKRLVEKSAMLENLSYVDHLTGVHNLRSIMNKLVEELPRTARYHHVTSIALIDLDHFKQVNDQFGHIFGDEVLRTFATMAKNHLRETDAVGRYGGEEFLLVLPETPVREAVEIVDRLRNQLKDHVWDGNEVILTFSAGLLELEERHCSLDVRTLIDSADVALYKAKTEGRDRTVVANHHI